MLETPLWCLRPCLSPLSFLKVICFFTCAQSLAAATLTMPSLEYADSLTQYHVAASPAPLEFERNLLDDKKMNFINLMCRYGIITVSHPSVLQ